MSGEQKPSALAVRLATAEPPTLDLLKELSDRVAKLLHELAAREEPSKQVAVWLVRRVDVGSLSIEVEGQPAQAESSPLFIDSLCQQLLEDIGSITRDPVGWSEQRDGTAPDFLRALRDLGALAVEHRASVAVEYGDRSAEVGGLLVQQVDALFQTKFQDWGAVEGYLEMVTLHRQYYFRIYPAGVARGVECHFDKDLLPKVRELLGRRVSVWGKLHRSRASSIERVDVKEIEPLETKSLDEIRPPEPLWPGRTSEELHRWSWAE